MMRHQAPRLETDILGAKLGPASIAGMGGEAPLTQCTHASTQMCWVVRSGPGSADELLLEIHAH
jgi:hypothetical protein